MKKRPIEDYEEIALYIWTARKLLVRAANIYARAAFVDRILRIDQKLKLLNYHLSEELEKDYPYMRGINPFLDKKFCLESGKNHIFSCGE